MATSCYLCAVIFLLVSAGNRLPVDGLPTVLCPGPVLNCFTCVPPSQYTGPCGCPMCAVDPNPCLGIMCPDNCVLPISSLSASGLSSAAQIAQPPAPSSCCPKCG
ncbi:uncharacterized protein LOC129591813 [Paramacrobiotus metropolitanus]|uniref:uncharacterized protein LOC129591813 n=1 Tax=Paramacrobiotus metropolitanus TaxID=2943436 RepID=UPI00244580F6|nr:uncharacterized protein LOC129591813 [Paramacrobiotus metropolitanus]